LVQKIGQVTPANESDSTDDPFHGIELENLRRHFQPDELRDVAKNIESSNILRSSFQPCLLLSSALILAAGDNPNRASSLYSSWRPYIAGELALHTIHYPHRDFMEAEAVAQIGRITNEALTLFDREETVKKGVSS
jgi:hypothetical protein